MPRSTNTQFAVAVHVLAYLAGDLGSRPVSSEELSLSTNVTPVYVRRVLGPLRQAGLVRSRAGAHGGWELAVDAHDVTLAQVWRILQGTDPVLGLHGPDPACRVGRGVQESLIALDQVVAAALEAELEHHTVHAILEGHIPSATAGRLSNGAGPPAARRARSDEADEEVSGTPGASAATPATTSSP